MSEERPETCPICHTPVVWCTCKGEKPMDEMGEELYLDEDFRMLAKTYPADVSAIGVTTLIDYVEAVEAELARLTALVERLKEDAERLAKYCQHIPMPDTTCWMSSSGAWNCNCGATEAFYIHRTLMKELE